MDLSDVRRRLEERRRQIASRVTRIEGDLRRPGHPDWEERASEAENEEVLESLGEQERRELEQIQGALGRIDAGSYGHCVQCGGPIDARRLAALPTASTCIGCAA